MYFSPSSTSCWSFTAPVRIHRSEIRGQKSRFKFSTLHWNCLLTCSHRQNCDLRSYIFNHTHWERKVWEGLKNIGHTGVNMYFPALYRNISEFHFLNSTIPLFVLPSHLYSTLWCSLQQSDQPYFSLVPETKPSALSWTGVKWGKVCGEGRTCPLLHPSHSLYVLPPPKRQHPCPDTEGGGIDGRRRVAGSFSTG